MTPATLGRTVARSVLDPTRNVARRPRPLRVSWLPVAVVLLAFLVPGNFVIPGPLRSNGSPSRLFSLACLVLAVLTLVAAARRRSDDDEPRWSLTGGAVVLYLAAGTISYGVANTRALDAGEAAGALRSLVGVLGVTGVTLYVWLLVRDRSDADRILGWIVAGATFSVVVAMLSAVGVIPSWASLARMTGLVENTPTQGAMSRLAFIRARGTGEHPIEFSLATTAALPLALHYARFARTSATRGWSGVASVLLLVGVPLAVSRTAVLGLVVAVVVAVSIWPPVQRFAAVLVGAAAVTALFVLVPDLVRSLTQIFTQAGEDDSITGRLSDYAIVEQMFRENPVLGIGMGVYRPENGGVFLDNTWLSTLIGAGVLGVLAFAVLFLVPAGVAWDRSVLAPDAVARSLNRALLAVIAVSVVGTFTSDFTSFQQPTVILMIALGVLASRAGSLPKVVPARAVVSR